MITGYAEVIGDHTYGIITCAACFTGAGPDEEWDQTTHDEPHPCVFQCDRCGRIITRKLLNGAPRFQTMSVRPFADAPDVVYQVHNAGLVVSLGSASPQSAVSLLFRQLRKADEIADYLNEHDEPRRSEA